MACGTFQISLPCTNHEINPSKKWRYHHLLRNWWAPNVPCRKQWRLLSKLPAMQSGLGRIKPSAKLKQIPTATKVSTQNCRVSFFDNVVVLWLQKPHNGEYTYLRTKRSPMSRVYTQPLPPQTKGRRRYVLEKKVVKLYCSLHWRYSTRNHQFRIGCYSTRNRQFRIWK